MSDAYNFTDVLASAATVITNPDPNTLVGTTVPSHEPGSAWVLQGTKAIYPMIMEAGRPNEPIPISIETSVAGAEHTTILWVYNPESEVWIQPAQAEFTHTGSVISHIQDPFTMWMYLEVSYISSGTLKITLPGKLARAY